MHIAKTSKLRQRFMSTLVILQVHSMSKNNINPSTIITVLYNLGVNENILDLKNS